MDPAYTYVAAPGAPLHPVSPERANQQKRSRPEIPPSPSLPNIPGFAQALMSADVRSKVAQFNSLDTKDVTERRRGHEAALRRAVLGREEAENETKRAKEEIEELNHELEEYKRREEKVARRLERAMVLGIYRFVYYSLSWANLIPGGTTSLQRQVAADQRDTLALSVYVREGDTKNAKRSIQIIVGTGEIAGGTQSSS